MKPVLKIITKKSTITDKSYSLSLLEEVGDNKYLLEMLNTFLVKMPVQLLDLQNAGVGQDCTNLFHVAHKLKGSISLLGASDLCNTLAGIEQQAKMNIVDKVLIDQVPVLYSHLEEYLRKEVLRVELLAVS